MRLGEWKRRPISLMDPGPGATPRCPRGTGDPHCGSPTTMHGTSGQDSPRCPRGQLIIRRRFTAGSALPPQFSVPAARLKRRVVSPSLFAVASDCRVQLPGQVPDERRLGRRGSGRVIGGRNVATPAWSAPLSSRHQASRWDRGLSMWFAKCLRPTWAHISPEDLHPQAVTLLSFTMACVG